MLHVLHSEIDAMRSLCGTKKNIYILVNKNVTCTTAEQPATIKMRCRLTMCQEEKKKKKKWIEMEWDGMRISLSNGQISANIFIKIKSISRIRIFLLHTHAHTHIHSHYLHDIIKSKPNVISQGTRYETLPERK